MFFGRGPNKIKNLLTSKDAYAVFKKDVIEGSPYDISLDEYREILNELNKEIMNMVIDEGMCIRLPFLGTLDIMKYKMKLGKTKWIPVDFKKSAELGKRIININQHTSGYKYAFRWSKNGVRLTYIHYYRFIPSRRNKRHLAYILNNRIRDYFEK